MSIWKWTVRLEIQIDDKYIRHILSRNMSRYIWTLLDETNIYDFYLRLETETDEICHFAGM